MLSLMVDVVAQYDLFFRACEGLAMIVFAFIFFLFRLISLLIDDLWISKLSLTLGWPYCPSFSVFSTFLALWLSLSFTSLHLSYTVFYWAFNRNMELYIAPSGWLAWAGGLAAANEPMWVMIICNLVFELIIHSALSTATNKHCSCH